MKKNLIGYVLDLFAPNRCYFCQKIGENICDSCFERQNFHFTIVENPKNSPIEFEFYINVRAGELQKIIDDWKFNNKKENYLILAEILKTAISKDSKFNSKAEFSLVPAPTSEKHRRQRSFAHMEILAKKLAEDLGFSIFSGLARKSNFVQRGADAKTRKLQAKKSYFLKNPPLCDKTYIIFDDIKTTGSTISEIAKIFRKSGAEKIWAIYILKQEKDKSP